MDTVAHHSPHADRVEKRIPQKGSDGSNEVVYTIVSAVAECTDREETDLEPLYEVIDPKAIEKIHEPLQNGRLRANGGRTEFTYAGCDVLVANSKVTVEPTERVTSD